MLDYQKKLKPLLYKKSKEQILAFIKSEISTAEYEIAINSNPFLKKAKLLGNRFQNVEEIFQRHLYGFTGNLKKELFWSIYNLTQEPDLINLFLHNKNLFEEQILLGNYAEAETILGSIRNNSGENLWTIEMTLLLKEYKYGTKENWKELSEYLTKLKSPFYKFLINFYSKRIEENMSVENCFTQFQNDFDAVVSDSMVKDFIVFKSIFFANFTYEHDDLEGVLFISNLFSVIDQYLIMIEVLIKLISTSKKNDKIILNLVKRLISKNIQDYRLFNIVNLLEEKNEILIQEKNKSILQVIDEYSLGNFENCIQLCSNKLKDNPSVFELYEIYCKSLINLGNDFQPTKISILIDKVLDATYRALLFNEESERFRSKILKYSLTFLSFNFGKQLSAFANLLVGDEYSNGHLIIGCLSSSTNNPRLLTFNLDNRNNILQKYNVFKDRPSFNTNLFIIGRNDENDTHISKNKLQADVYLSKRLFNQGEFEKVIEILISYVNNNQQIVPFYYDNILSLLFESYLNTNLLKEGMQLYASILADRKFYTNRFDVIELCEKIKINGVENFANFIELPILFSSTSKDYDLYEIYIEFMLSQGIEYPSKLSINHLISQFSLEKIIYFLRYVCTISTIQYSLEFSSIDKAEQERHEIYNLLKQLDNRNSSIYDNEIAEILRAGAVRKAIKEVDEGRLYVNIESLKNLQMNNVKESFNRYKEIELTTKNNGLIGFNASKERNWINPEFQQNNLNPELNNQAFLAFKSIYIETRDKFLFSKEYGLESCLSGRIRHGTLKNLLRSVFEKLNLITSKSGDTYIDNVYWQEQFRYDMALNKNIQDSLKKFSRGIDDLTTHIVDSQIQIQTEKNTDKSNGLFNYASNDTSLNEFFNLFKDSFDNYNSLITRIYSELAATTSLHIVPYVKKILTTDIKNKFQRLIEELQAGIRSHSDNNPNLFPKELLANVSKSSTDIQTELDNVAEWFNFSTSDSSSLLDIETILNASKELTNKFNPSCSIEPEIILNCPKDLSVIASSMLIFVFHILMDNIIKHSKLNSPSIVVRIIVNQIDDFIEIKVINNIHPSVDLEVITERLKSIKENWNNNEKIERSSLEGGSGFDKIKRILLYEALAKTDKFEFSIDQDEVSISLFLPFKTLNNEQSVNN